MVSNRRPSAHTICVLSPHGGERSVLRLACSTRNVFRSDEERNRVLSVVVVIVVVFTSAIVLVAESGRET